MKEYGPERLFHNRNQKSKRQAKKEKLETNFESNQTVTIFISIFFFDVFVIILMRTNLEKKRI